MTVLILTPNIERVVLVIAHWRVWLEPNLWRLRKLLFLHSVSVTMVASLNDPYDMCSELHGVIVGVVV